MAFNLFNFSNGQSKEINFWNWFIKNESRIFSFESNQEKIFNELSRELKKINKSLTFEFGPVEKKMREFVISADGDKQAFPSVLALKEKQPENLNNFYVTYFRPRQTEPMARITYDNLTLSIEDVSYKLEQSDDKIDVTFFIKGFTENRKRDFFGPIFIMLDHTLGEFDIEMKIGAIELKQDEGNNSYKNFKFLQKDFDELIKRTSIPN
ncbi:MAG: hypothetical protein IPM56_00740 [Ignavibacteriales bacterium]|nr:MAG: hypothetical protein IPM56_00740 [Ignavibacteriales bacterium]